MKDKGFQLIVLCIYLFWQIFDHDNAFCSVYRCIWFYVDGSGYLCRYFTYPATISQHCRLYLHEIYFIQIDVIIIFVNSPRDVESIAARVFSFTGIRIVGNTVRFLSSQIIINVSESARHETHHLRVCHIDSVFQERSSQCILVRIYLRKGIRHWIIRLIMIEISQYMTCVSEIIIPRNVFCHITFRIKICDFVIPYCC